MTTHLIPILGSLTVPDGSGEVRQRLYSDIDSGAVVDPLIWEFANSGTKDGLRGAFKVPQNYVGTPKLVIVWTANATTGTVVFDWSVLPRSGTEDMGAAAARTSETGSVTKSGTAFAREEHSIALTAADYAAGDDVLFELFRDTITDTMAASTAVFGVYFQYDDA